MHSAKIIILPDAEETVLKENAEEEAILTASAVIETDVPITGWILNSFYFNSRQAQAS